jgi:amino acid transporter
MTSINKPARPGGTSPAGPAEPAPADLVSGKKLKAGAVSIVGVLFMALAGSAPITAMTGNVPIAVGFGNGVGTPGAFVLATAVLFVFSIGYAAMSRHVTAAGAFYGYISHGLGQTVGMASGLLATLAYVVFEASLIGIFASFARTTIASFGGPTISWIWIAAVGMTVIAAMGYFDIRLSGRVLAVFLVSEIAILLLLGLAVLIRGGGPDGLMVGSLNPLKAFTAVPGDAKAGIVGSAGIGLFFAFWSWVGFETVAVYGEESRNPKKFVPRAVLIAVLLVGAIYVFMSWMAVAGNGTAQAIAQSRSSDPFNLFFGITASFVGGWAKDVYEVLIITGSFACALSFHNTASRYIYALGREAPGARIRGTFGATHHRHQSPHVASILQSVITVAIVLAFFWLQKPSAQAPDVAYDYVFGLMAILGTMIILICQTLCSLSVISYFHIQKNHQETANWWRTLLAPLAGAVAMGYVVYLLIHNLSFAAGAASSSPVFKAIPYIVLATAVIGLAFALVLRKAQPARYKIMGRTVLDESRERGEEEAAVMP